MTTSTQSSGLNSIQTQWIQILQQTQDQFPRKYDGNEDLVLMSKKNARYVSFSGDVDVKINNLVIRSPIFIKTISEASEKKARIFCNTIFIIDGILKLLDVHLYALNIIQMSEKQFKESVDALLGMQFHELPKGCKNEFVYFPPNTQLSCRLNASLIEGQTGLMIAAQKGNEAVAKLLMTAKADLEAENEVGWRALQFAVKENHHSIVNLLLSAKAHVNTEDLLGNSPLFLAAEFDDPSIAKTLLDAKAYPLQVNYSGETPLSISIQCSSTEVFRLLKEVIGQVNPPSFTSSPNEMSETLMDAAIKGDMAQFEIFFSQGVNFNAKTGAGDTPLTVAAKYNQRKAVDFLIAAKANVQAAGKNDRTALKWATMNGSEEIVRSLLKAKASIQASRLDGPLAIAMQGKQQSIVQLFLQRLLPEKIHKIENLLEKAIQSNLLSLARELHSIGAKLKKPKNGSIELFNAAVKEQDEMVGFLLSVNANLPGALLLAVKGGHIEVTARFIKTGASVNTADESKQSLLVHAIRGNHTLLATYLIESNAQVDSRDFRRMTPLMHSLVHGDEVIANLLLDKLADYRARAENEWTPLMYAARYGQTFTARRILNMLKEKAEQEGYKNCVGIDDKSRRGKTALILASIYERSTIVDILLEKGANMHAQTDKQKNALDCAAKHGHIALVERLLREKYSPIDCMSALQHTKRAKMKALTPVKINKLERIIEILSKKIGPAIEDFMINVQQKTQVDSPQQRTGRITWKNPLNEYAEEFKTEQKGNTASDEEIEG